MLPTSLSKSSPKEIIEPVAGYTFSEALSSSDQVELPECPIKEGSPPQLRSPDDHEKESKPSKPNICTRIGKKFLNFIYSRNFKVFMILAAIVNVLQLITFFLICILYLPKRTRKNLNNNEIEFIVDHIADKYIDYDFFANESVL